MRQTDIVEKLRSFFSRKNVRLSPRLYFVDAMSSMALGLFATLLMGTILQTLGKYTGIAFFTEIATFANTATGAILAVAVAYRLDAPPLVLFSAAAVGLMGYNGGASFLLDGAEKSVTAGPAGAFLCALVATEIGKLVSKETPVDILVTPLVTLLAGFGVAKLVSFPIAYLMFVIGDFVNTTTALYPVFMGALVAVVVGIVLTLPISSAALCAMIGISGLAGGAAAAGCCAQMVGFAVISYRDNKLGGLVAQGLGTSMLQMGNIVKKPQIWIPATCASAVTGALSAAVFALPCSGVSAGMGTCGMVGVIGVIGDLLASENASVLQWIGVPFVLLILPAALSLLIAAVMRKKGWILDGDMKLDL